MSWLICSPLTESTETRCRYRRSRRC
jgi:hypothetical protein